MISRKRLLSLIDNAIQTEERLVGVYCSNLLAFPEVLGADEQAQERHRKLFLTLRDESRQHKSRLEDLRARIEKDPRNAY